MSLNLLAATRMTRVARIPMLALDRHLGFSSLTWVVVHIPIAAAYWVWAHQNTVEEIRAFRTCTTGIIQPTVASGKFAVTIFQNALWRLHSWLQGLLCSMDMPAAAAKQALEYVTLSQPQTGSKVLGHAGLGSVFV